MKKVLAACTLALLAACGGSSPSADGYTFEKEEFNRPSQRVDVVVYDSSDALRRAAQERGIELPPGRMLMAYGVIHPDRCVIHMVSPAKDYQPEWIGHEFTHCVYGRWHPSQG